MTQSKKMKIVQCSVCKRDMMRSQRMDFMVCPECKKKAQKEKYNALKNEANNSTEAKS